MNKRHLRRWLTLAIITAMPTFVGAQEPAAIRKIGLPSLDSQVHARLLALDRKLDLVHSPALATSIVAQLFLPASPLTAFTPILTNSRNLQVWEQLPDDYRRLMQESGEALLAQEDAPAGAAWSAGQTRRLCHQRLAMLPRACLESYRQGIDAEAKALLEEGRRTQNPVPLRRLVDEMFCSSVGAQALDLLGDLAFERGHFLESQYWWNLLAPLGGTDQREDRLRFPDPRLDVARVEAKQILGMIFAGRLDEARPEIARFRKRHPGARGALAGQDDSYGAILQRVLTNFVAERIANNDEPWTTFGGDAARNRALTRGLNWHQWADGPTWRVKLPGVVDRAGSELAAPDRWSLNRRAAFHPIVVNSQVLIADHRSAVSYDLATGKELFRFDLASAGLEDVPEGVPQDVRLPRFTLSADDERAYVRLGRLGIAGKRNAGHDGPSYLICLDITQPHVKKPRLLWHVKAGLENKVSSYFEGAPLVGDGRVYIARSKVFDRRTLTSIVCYDVVGKPRWSREVCECPEFEDRAEAPRYRQHLLTWAGGQVVYASNAGAIVAVDAWTGQPTWGVRYPSRGRLLSDAVPSPRDLAPCVYAQGRIYAAPVDTDRLFCVDATTGQVHWDLDGVEIVQLLGVAQGRVVMTTRTGVQAVDAASGLVEWMQPVAGRLPGLGRGLIAGSWLFWPTTDPTLPYRAVTLGKGQQQIRKSAETEPAFYDPTLFSGMPVGNLAFGQGCLVVAGLKEMIVYVPPQTLPRAPGDHPQARIDILLEQARSQACAGAPAKAARTYLDLLEATRSHPKASDWRTLIEGRLQMLARQLPPGEACTIARQTHLKAFIDPPMPAPVRLSAWEGAFDWALQANRTDDALGFCRRILDDPDLRSAWLPGSPPRQGGAWALGQRRHLLREHADDPVPTGKARTERDPPAWAAPFPPTLPLVQAWAEPAEHVCPLHDDDSRGDTFFCTQASRISCRSSVDGNLRWRQKLVFVPEWFSRWHDLAVLAGPDGVEARHVADGRLAWTFPAGSRMLQVGSVDNGAPRLPNVTGGFVHVETWDDTLLLLDDGRKFYRLRLDTGEIAWQYASPDAGLRPLDAACFCSKLVHVGKDLIVQDAMGQPQVLGSKLTPLGLASRCWVQAPLVADDKIVMAGERGRIDAYDTAHSHAARWTYHVRGPSSLTGSLPRLFGNESMVLALVSRNDSQEWTCLDLHKGTPLWSTRTSDLDAASVCMGDTSFFYERAGTLHARSLNDGSIQWSLPLPGRSSRWQVRYTKAYLVVNPFDEKKDADFFVGFIDPGDGQWLQRLAFSGRAGVAKSCSRAVRW